LATSPHGLISPAVFMPLAEEMGLILPLGRWVLETACRQLASWETQPATASLQMAVNISVRQFRHPDFVKQIMAALAHTGVRPHKLKLELTESLMVDDMEATIAKMTALKWL
jgi:EAL domain-containing protein (putative c-di-GMP-specific phosphodiesterase class I)